MVEIANRINVLVGGAGWYHTVRSPMSWGSQGMFILRLLSSGSKVMNYFCWCYGIPPNFTCPNLKNLVMVAFVISNMATYPFAIFNGVAQIYLAPCLCTSFLTEVARIIRLLLLCLTYFWCQGILPSSTFGEPLCALAGEHTMSASSFNLLDGFWLRLLQYFWGVTASPLPSCHSKCSSPFHAHLLGPCCADEPEASLHMIALTVLTGTNHVPAPSLPFP